MYSSAIMKLEQRVEKLEEKVDKQAEEINILKNILNNICESIREDKEKINMLMLQKDIDDKTDAIYKQLGIKTEKGMAIIFDKSPTDEDFMKVQELISKEEEHRSDPREYLGIFNEHDGG